MNSVILLFQEVSIITDRQSLPNIISEITSEISDADNATNSLKFKSKYARHRIPKPLKCPQNISLKYDFYKGTRRMKLLDSNEIRTLRDVCIFEVNGMEVYM